MSEGDPLVSVIVLTWNRRAMLAETLESVAGQTVEDLEILVVDNESTDDTESYIQGFAVRDTRVRYLRNANGGNLSVNRNFGIGCARGRWIAFCDDDDLWEPDKLQKQFAVLETHPDAALIGTNAVYFCGDDIYGNLLPSRGSRPLSLSDMLRGRNEIVLSSALVRADAFERAGMFDEDPDLFTVEDLHMWIRILAAGLAAFTVDEPLVRYRVHGAMTSHRDSRIMVGKLQRMVDRLHDEGVLEDETWREARASQAALMRRARFKEALKRVPGLKRLVYRSRAVRAGVSHRSSEHRDV